MTVDIQFKLKNNPEYISYLRNNSHWYKELNRNPSSFNKFQDEVKTKNSIDKTERLKKTLEMISVLQNIITTIK